MSLVTEDIRASASEIYRGKEICRVQAKMFLEEIGLPDGLLPLEDIQECGLVRETGFIWLKLKQKTVHMFGKLGKVGQYETEVTAYFEPKKLTKVTGIKAKEFFMWITVCEVSVDDPPTGKLTFKTPAGLFRTYPVSAFQAEDPEILEEANGACEEI